MVGTRYLYAGASLDTLQLAMVLHLDEPRKYYPADSSGGSVASPFSKAVSQIDILYVQNPSGYKRKKSKLHICTRLIYEILTLSYSR